MGSSSKPEKSKAQRMSERQTIRQIKEEKREKKRLAREARLDRTARSKGLRGFQALVGRGQAGGFKDKAGNIRKA